MSAYFNPPPGWPAPPSPQWQPQAQWQPDPSWPAAPQGWPFWVDESGEPTERPAGSYPPQQTGRRNKVLGCGCLTVVALVLFGACGAVLSMGEEQARVEVTVTPTTTVTPTAVVTPTTTAPAPTQTNPAQTTTITPTVTVAPPPPPEPTPTPEPEPAPEPEPTPAPVPEPTEEDPGSAYYENCDAVRAAGAAPIFRGDPGYSSKLDRDGDGVGCEP